MKPPVAAKLAAALVATLTLATLDDATAVGLDGAPSRFTDLVLARTHPGVAETAAPARLRWNLGDRREVLYRLEQQELQTTTQRLDGASRTFERESLTSGTLVVHADGEGRSGEVRFEDLEARTTVRAGGSSESASAGLPSLVAMGLTEAGRVEGDRDAAGPSSVDNLVTGLFVLPTKALGRGESEEVPVRFGAAVQWGESRDRMETYPVIVEGVATVTAAGRERLETCRCMRLDISFELEAGPPEGFPGRMRALVRGTGRTWFDDRARRMAEGELALLIGIDLAAPERPEDAGMTIVTDTHTRVRIGR